MKRFEHRDLIIYRLAGITLVAKGDEPWYVETLGPGYGFYDGDGRTGGNNHGYGCGEGCGTLTGDGWGEGFGGEQTGDGDEASNGRRFGET